MTNARIPRKLGEFTNMQAQMLNGVSELAKSDPNFRRFVDVLAASHRRLVEANKEQESLKVAHKKSTEAIQNELAAIRPVILSCIAGLEEKFGMYSGLLELFGIRPRKKTGPSGGHAPGPQAKAA
jgi:hypothetical protein